MPENIRISVVEVPYTTKRYVYFAGNRKASCILKCYSKYLKGEPMKRNKRQIMTWPSMLVLFFFAFVPLIIMFVTSFKSDATGAFTLENYARFFQKAMYIKLTGKTIVNALLVTVVSLVVAYPLAYIMAKKLKGLKNMNTCTCYYPVFYKSARKSVQLAHISSRTEAYSAAFSTASDFSLTASAYFIRRLQL